MIGGNRSGEPFISDLEQRQRRSYIAIGLPLPLASAPEGGRGGMLFWLSHILYIIFLIAMQCSLKFFAGRYLGDIVQLSLLASCLVALRQRQANRPVARIKSDEERETQVYDCPFYGLRPASH
jgi:hypothetical protein